MSSISKTAGIVIIGNEVLSGKTQDTNSHFLCTELRALGVEVRRISVIPDEIELIGREVASFSSAFDFVFTTGGVGPTHDDVTMAGIARGFGVQVIRHPELERRLRVTEPVIKFLTVRTDEEDKRLEKVKKIRASRVRRSSQPAETGAEPAAAVGA